MPLYQHAQLKNLPSITIFLKFLFYLHYTPKHCSPPPPFGHQATQEEVLICPSHTAVLANYFDLMSILAGVWGEARCYCIGPPAPEVVFITLNRLPPPWPGAALLCRENLNELAQDVTHPGHTVWPLDIDSGLGWVCVCRDLYNYKLALPAFIHIFLLFVGFSVALS